MGLAFAFSTKVMVISGDGIWDLDAWCYAEPAGRSRASAASHRGDRVGARGPFFAGACASRSRASEIT